MPHVRRGVPASVPLDDKRRPSGRVFASRSDGKAPESPDRGPRRACGWTDEQGRPSPTATDPGGRNARHVHPQADPRPETVKKGHKWCPRCGEVKVHDRFARNKASKDGLYSICKECEGIERMRAKERKAVAAAKSKRTRSRKAPTA